MFVMENCVLQKLCLDFSSPERFFSGDFKPPTGHRYRYLTLAVVMGSTRINVPDTKHFYADPDLHICTGSGMLI